MFLREYYLYYICLKSEYNCTNELSLKGVRQKLANTHTFSKGEEIANSITHGIGGLLSMAGLVILIVFSSSYGSALHIVSFTIFGITMVLLYTASTLVHSFPAGKAKDVFEILDHSAIYFFIAGSYTPFLFIAVKGWIGWTLFGIVWGLAIVGTLFKAFFVKKYVFFSTLMYVIMGWLIILAWGQITENVAYNGVLLLVVGGVLYTIGAIFYVWRGFKYHHAVWHLFVLAGTILHFFSVLFYLL
jgi:hemolysin III